jgi:hypothetical protein
MSPPGTLDAASEAARGSYLFFSIGVSNLVCPAAPASREHDL